MPKTTAMRKYGKQQKKPKFDRLFVELPQTPVTTTRKTTKSDQKDDAISELTKTVRAIDLQDEKENSPKPAKVKTVAVGRRRKKNDNSKPLPEVQGATLEPGPDPEPVEPQDKETQPEEANDVIPKEELRVLSWSEVCPPGDKIVKIAEASYAEVYRVTNDRGTSIIKVIRMQSPIKTQTKAQEKSGLVDEEPHHESDLMGELQISEWLADIPGFVVYKERYIVQGKACRELLETHQAFHKKAKRKDLDRLQFYPSPSRYLDGTKFLVVELGDAGTALEDFELASTDQLWDIFFHVAIALARAEAQIEFEHRDLHEGNLCIRMTGEPHSPEERDSLTYFGHSGLEITILDYGLSRARENVETDEVKSVAYDLERDLNLFNSEHAPQCRVYRQMRSFFLRGDRVCMPPKSHKTPYEHGIEGPINWGEHEPYTNVLWLAYIYGYLVGNFTGPRKELNAFKRVTKEFWLYLNPEAGNSVPGFASAADIVAFAVESGWIEEEQLTGGREVEASILSINFEDLRIGEPAVRRSPRRHRHRYIE